jgi:hypothetical protein
MSLPHHPPSFFVFWLPFSHPPLKLLPELIQSDTPRPEEDQGVEPEVDHLINNLTPAAPLDTQEDFGGLLSNLLEDLIFPLFEEGGHIRTRRSLLLALQNGPIDLIEDLG